MCNVKVTCTLNQQQCQLRIISGQMDMYYLNMILFDCSCPALHVQFGQSTYRVPETAGNVTVCANVSSFLDRNVNLTIRTCVSDDTATEEGRRRGGV